MKNKILLFIIAFVLAVSAKEARAVTGSDLISKTKLQQDALPAEMQILKEISGTEQQLRHVRLRVGFPVVALLNQVITFQKEQAQVNYLAVQNDSWLQTGYSTLVDLDSERSFIFIKNYLIIQVAATTRELEEEIARILGADPIHFLKLRTKNLPDKWSLIKEKVLFANDLRQLENLAGVPLEASLVQEIGAGHVNISIRYFRCDSASSSSELAQKMADQKKQLYKMLIGLCGSDVVVVESQNEEINKDAMSLITWPKDCEAHLFLIRY